MPSTVLDNKKPLTLEDVARELGVSRSTVSAAFTGNGNITAARREAVRSAAVKLGYRPNPHARRLAVGDQDNSIALVTSYLDQDVGSQKLQILQRILIEKGYNASVHVLGEIIMSESTAQAVVIENLRRLRPLAIVWNQWTLNIAARDELNHFCEEGGKMVHYDVPLDLKCDQVIFDREHDGYIAMRHLLELGHREVGFVIPSDDQWRIRGIRRALQEFNVPLRPVWLDVPRKGKYEETGGHLAVFFLAQKPRPTAISIVNDNVSIGFVAALQRRGLRVPEDVSVVSHNDTRVAKWGANVQLTSVSQPIDRIAEQAGELLLDRLEGKYDGPPRIVTVRGKLSVRESTAPFTKR
jgi:LacI family transcriptional regulator